VNERPKLRPDLVRRDLEDDLLLFDPRCGEVHLLNVTAAAVAEMCDGQTSVPEMARELVAALSVDAATVEADLDRILGEFAAKELMDEGG
jgi:PqqD family protein of HPr-rel-A system